MKIGFVGLGNIGASIARDLARSDHDLIVFDHDRETLEEFARLGVAVGADSAEVARHAEVLGLCVRTDEQLLEALRCENGIYAGARPGLTLAIHSTIHLHTLAEIRVDAERYGIRIVDAPVSRGTDAPPTKAINFLLGGDPEDVAKVAAYVEPAALSVVETGPIGSALLLKICNNVLTYLGVIMLRDVFRIMDAAKIDLNSVSRLVTNNGVGSANMLYLINRRLGELPGIHHQVGSTEVNAALGEKDLSCALEAAEMLGVQVPAISFSIGQIREALLEI